jgi:TonB family protein
MDWQDEEFEAFLRQFRPRRPKPLPTYRRHIVIAALAAAVVLAVVVPTRWLSDAGDDPARSESGASSRTAAEGRATPGRMERTDARLTAAASRVAHVDVKLAAYSIEDSAGGAVPPESGSQVVMSLPAIPPRRTLLTVTPRYPPEAERLGLEGTVDLRLTVNAAGDVTRTERVRSTMELRPDDENGAERVEYYAKNPFAFASESERAAKAWRFEPAKTRMTVVVSFAFTFKDSSEPAGAGAFPAGLPTLSPVPGLSRPGPAPAPAVGARGTSSSQRVRVGGAIKPPVRLVNVNPEYPEEAQAARIEGTVILEIVIGVDGSVIDARVLRSIPELDQAAIDAVLQWVYEPTLLNGEAVEVEVTVTVNFTLR